jgi:hypothetical protein
MKSLGESAIDQFDRQLDPRLDTNLPLILPGAVMHDFINVPSGRQQEYSTSGNNGPIRNLPESTINIHETKSLNVIRFFHGSIKDSNLTEG